MCIICFMVGLCMGYVVYRAFRCVRRRRSVINSNSLVTDGSIRGSITQNNGKLRIGNLEFVGSNFKIRAGQVWVDGKLAYPEPGSPASESTVVYKTLTVEGKVEHVNLTQGSLAITGDATNIKVDNGNVRIGGNCRGSCSTHTGNIKIAGDCTGDCSTTIGNIKSRTITGDASSSIGNVRVPQRRHRANSEG